MKEEQSLLKILFGGKQENRLIIAFISSLVIFTLLGILISTETIEATALIKGLLLTSGLVMIFVLVLLPFLSFRHMTKKK